MPFDPAATRVPEPNKLQSDGFIAQPTELGLANPAMQLEDSPQDSQSRWKKLPPLYWMIEVSDLNPAARVLAENPSRFGPDGKRLPLIILQYAGGGGRVLFHATDETYRWRRPVWEISTSPGIGYRCCVPRTVEAGRSRPIREVDHRSPGLSAGRSGSHASRLPRRAAPLDDGGVTISLEQTGRETEKVQLRRALEALDRGRFEAVLSNLPAGGYHAKMIAPTLLSGVPAVDFVVASPQTELTRLQMDAAAMQQAAAMTNGKYYALQDAARLPADLPGGRQVPVENLPSVPLWNRWPVLLLFLGC